MSSLLAAIYCTGLVMESARAWWLIKNEPGIRDRAKEYGKWITAGAMALCVVFWPCRIIKNLFQK